MVKWKLVSVRLEIVLISAQDRCTVCANFTTGMKPFWAQPKVHLGDVRQVEPISVHLEIVLV
jgi:hypothetical protein